MSNVIILSMMVKSLKVVGSPFIQEIEELSPSATGEGLKRGREGHKSVFKVDARGFPGELSVYVDGNCFNISLHK